MDEKRLHRCCFSGHRPEKLRSSEKDVKAWLEGEILQAAEEGYTTFITGMAMGVDIWAGEIVVRLRETMPRLHLIAAVPYHGFEAKWNPAWQKQFHDLLKAADIVRIICIGFDPEAFNKRNEWMVDRSARLIAFYNGESGGTLRTINYARKQGIEIRVQEDVDEKPLTIDIPDMQTTERLLAAIGFAEERPEDIRTRMRACLVTMSQKRMAEVLLMRYRDLLPPGEAGKALTLSAEGLTRLEEQAIRQLSHKTRLKFLAGCNEVITPLQQKLIAEMADTTGTEHH